MNSLTETKGGGGHIIPLAKESVLRSAVLVQHSHAVEPFAKLDSH